MKLRIVLEDHKYQIERKGLFRWIKIGTKTPVGKTIQYPIKCETIDEAIEFAIQIKTKLTIPMHYDMYTLNTANVADFVSKAQDRFNFLIMQVGIPVRIVDF